MSLQVPKDLKLIVTNEDADETLDFLSFTFVREEPLIQTMCIDDHCDLIRYLKKQLTNDTLTLKLVDNQCDIISAAVCTVITPQSSQDTRTFAGELSFGCIFALELLLDQILG